VKKIVKFIMVIYQDCCLSMTDKSLVKIKVCCWLGSTPKWNVISLYNFECSQSSFI